MPAAELEVLHRRVPAAASPLRPSMRVDSVVPSPAAAAAAVVVPPPGGFPGDGPPRLVPGEHPPARRCGPLPSPPSADSAALAAMAAAFLWVVHRKRRSAVPAAELEVLHQLMLRLGLGQTLKSRAPPNTRNKNQRRAQIGRAI